MLKSSKHLKNILVVKSNLKFQYFHNQNLTAMTTSTLKKKILSKIETSDNDVLQVVYNILNLYNDADNKSMLSVEQKLELDNRSKLLSSGKLKKVSLDEANKKISRKIASLK